MSNKKASEILRQILSLAHELAESKEVDPDEFAEVLQLSKDINRELSTLTYFGISDLVAQQDSSLFFKQLGEVIAHAGPDSYKDYPGFEATIEERLIASGLNNGLTLTQGSLKLFPGIGITFIANLPLKRRGYSSVRWSIGIKREALIFPITNRDKLNGKSFVNHNLYLNEHLPAVLPKIIEGILTQTSFAPIKNECTYQYLGKSYRCAKLSTDQEVNDFILHMESEFGEDWGLLYHDEENGNFYVASVDDLGV